MTLGLSRPQEHPRSTQERCQEFSERDAHSNTAVRHALRLIAVTTVRRIAQTDVVPGEVEYSAVLWTKSFS